MDLGLRDRACVVTGGSRGIGLAIARRLVDEGAHVLVTARRPDALCHAVAGLGERAQALELDVTDADAASGCWRRPSSPSAGSTCSSTTRAATT